VGDALYAALDSPHPSVRLAAVQGLDRHRRSCSSSSLGRVLCEDESWPVRCAARPARSLPAWPRCPQNTSPS
jgi:hypothetical protein